MTTPNECRRITAEEYGDPRTLPVPGWYFVPRCAGLIGNGWLKREFVWDRLSVAVATHVHPNQAEAPSLMPENQPEERIYKYDMHTNELIKHRSQNESPAPRSTT